MYTIKAVSTLTGLGAETLRAWERRYQAIVPNRDEGGRRLFSEQDLERLSLLADLTRTGHAISKLAPLDTPQLQALLLAREDGQAEQSRFTEQIVDALQDYRMDRCEQLLKRALLANEPLAYVRDILAPALNHVGQLWHEEKVSVAQEHMFSACVQRILLTWVNNLQGVVGNRPSMLFATPSGEPHEFGILMCSLLAADQRFDCYYLGANVPADDLIDAARKLKTDVVVLSLLKSPPDLEALMDLDRIADASAAENRTIWLGGRGAEYWLRLRNELPATFEIISDWDHFHAKARQRIYAA